jgi:hypothetical protein
MVLCLLGGDSGRATPAESARPLGTRSFLPGTIGLVLFISFPGWVLLFAGRSGYFFSVPATVTLVLIALATSVRTHFRGRAAVRKMELSADRRQITQVGGRTYRTRHGPVDGAQRFLGTFAEHGVPITEKTRNSD